jgi:hypothetical protein
MCPSKASFTCIAQHVAAALSWQSAIFTVVGWSIRSSGQCASALAVKRDESLTSCLLCFADWHRVLYGGFGARGQLLLHLPLYHVPGERCRRSGDWVQRQIASVFARVQSLKLTAGWHATELAYVQTSVVLHTSEGCCCSAADAPAGGVAVPHDRRTLAHPDRWVHHRVRPTASMLPSPNPLLKREHSVYSAIIRSNRSLRCCQLTICWSHAAPLSSC